MSLYQITLVTHVHGLAPRGPAGWGAIVRREGKAAQFRGHACHATHQEVEEGARALLTSSIGGKPHFFTKLDGPMTEAARADVRAAERLARSAAVVVGELMEVVS